MGFLKKGRAFCRPESLVSLISQQGVIDKLSHSWSGEQISILQVHNHFSVLVAKHSVLECHTSVKTVLCVSGRGSRTFCHI